MQQEDPIPRVADFIQVSRMRYATVSTEEGLLLVENGAP